MATLVAMVLVTSFAANISVVSATPKPGQNTACSGGAGDSSNPGNVCIHTQDGSRRR
jgi:hypothetical protein